MATRLQLSAFDTEYANTTLVRLGRLPVRVLNLDRIIASKQAAGRDRDRAVLPVLRDVWATLKARRFASQAELNRFLLDWEN